MRQTNVRHHIRRTRKGLRPVRQHRRKLNYSSTPIDKAPKVQLYHGTSKHLVSRIEKEGLKPWKETGNSQWGWISPADRVSLTPHKWQADWYAQRTAKAGTEPVVLKVVVPGEEYRQGKAEGERDAGNESVTKDEVRLPNVPPHMIKGVLKDRVKKAEVGLDKAANKSQWHKERLTYQEELFKSLFGDENEKNFGALVRDGEKVFLVDDNTKEKLARVKVNYESDETMNISDWKAIKKGEGYGKKLIEEIAKEKPDLFMVATDGLTKAGEANIVKALPEFKVTSIRPGAAILHRQDAIDYYIEQAETGRRLPFRFDPALHSRNKQDEQKD